ncbi:hypothetical protein J4E83_010979 [Alternaria metachromatica]|uniref:uncharacterized protein n=1 Tax=Alternaria metachromatica TaxID=283354 RepID=UPI0020C1C53C|nr:uncharacterized protein J4E83_010979 [Alternaria metachromatica]KAI4604738.1 hypothetical protein J4E83_010979 [Alternaria metachromatica]
MNTEEEQEEARAHITQRNATASPLLRLPAEIRNMIFAYALSHGDTKLHIIPSIQDGPGGTGCWKHRSWPDPVNVSLLYVCRQIHLETALLPYELNIFVVYGHYNAVKDFFERRTTAQIGAMARVERGPQVNMGVRTASDWSAVCSHPNPESSAFTSEIQPKYPSVYSSRIEVNKKRAIKEHAENLKVEAAQQDQRRNQM